MPTQLNAYINFRGKAREAMEFYKTVLGGKLDISTFKDLHADQDPSEADSVMHSLLTSESGLVLMASDVPKRMDYTKGTNNFSLSLSGDNEGELRSYFDKLAEGGQVTQPLTKAVWGDTFGMFIDKFGITWLINISGPKDQANQPSAENA